MLVIETPESQSASDAFEGSSGELAFLVRADVGESTQDVRRYMRTYTEETIPAPESENAPYRRSRIVVTPVPDGIGFYKSVVTYTQLKPQQFSFATGGGTSRITSSLETINGYTADLNPLPDFKQGINVTKHNVEGVDIVVPRLTFKISRTILADSITEEHLDTIERLTGTVNSEGIQLVINGIDRFYYAGELLLLGVDGQTTPANDLEETYTFAVSRNLQPAVDGPIVIGDITITEKDGWDYLWTFYIEQVATTSEGVAANVRALVPYAVLIDRVYRRKAFSLLELDVDFSQ